MATIEEIEARDGKIVMFRLLRCFAFGAIVWAIYHFLLPQVGPLIGLPARGYTFLVWAAAITGFFGFATEQSLYMWFMIPGMMLLVAARDSGLDPVILKLDGSIALPFVLGLLLLHLLRRSGKWPVLWM